MRTYIEFLKDYPSLLKIVEILDANYINSHPNFFSEDAIHPCLPVKRSKVIHDNLWGTVRFTWRELALIDSPIMQRLRDIHQTGLAFYVYPSSRHTRFEHSLGAATIASRVFDSLVIKNGGELEDIMTACYGNCDSHARISQTKQELRLAALLHDTGHSMYSHTSEHVYGNLLILNKATDELTAISGKKKGAGEVISFCIALTPSVERLMNNAGENVIGEVTSDDYNGPISTINVALLIVGRSLHPYLQFVGDIVSSGFDADKLDYLLRDARAAGLPLKYDIDRYLYDVKIVKDILADGKGQLAALYLRTTKNSINSFEPNSETRYRYFETYRLRLSRRSMNVVEQIVICKMMLFSYIYHHGKVRASEGLLEKLLRGQECYWRSCGWSEEKILTKYLQMTDSSLPTLDAGDGELGEMVKDYKYRIINRLIPRIVFSISGPSATHAERDMVNDFLLELNDSGKREELLASLEQRIGEEFVKTYPKIGSSPAASLRKTGVWVDAPKPPKFEDIDVMLSDGKTGASDVRMANLFPIEQWTDAYQHYRYQVRIFSFSEFVEETRIVAKNAMKPFLKIRSAEFYDVIERTR